MKFTKIYILIFSSLLPIIAQDSFADSLQVYKVSNVQQAGVLNVRSAPSSSANIILELPSDASWLLKRTAEKRGRWQKVIWGVKEGWVYDKYLSNDAKASQVALKHRQCIKNNPGNSLCCGVEPQNSKNRSLIKTYKLINVPAGESLNVRASGSASAKKIATIPHNAVGIVKFPGNQAQSGKTQWQLVRWNGRNGWVNSSYLAYDSIVSDYRNIVQQTCAY